MVKVYLYRFLYHIDILFVLILEARNNGNVIWFAQDVYFIGLVLHRSLQLGCHRTTHCLEHRRFGARRSILPPNRHHSFSTHLKIAPIMRLRSYVSYVGIEAVQPACIYRFSILVD